MHYRSAVIEESKRLVECNTHHALAYYYCEYGLPESQKLSNVLGFLLKQVCALSEGAFEELSAFYFTYNAKGNCVAFPSDVEIGSLLQRVSRHFDSVVVIIDGLDECALLEDRRRMLGFLSSLTQPEWGNIKAIYTSRDEHDIRQALKKSVSISIAARSHDLELFVAARIESRVKEKRLRLRDPTMKEFIINTIVAKANGMCVYLISC